MDARTLLLTRDQWALQAAEALLMLLPADRETWFLTPPIQALVDDLTSQGELELKTGRVAYVYRPAGLPAQRLIVSVVASGGGAKALARAANAAMPALKGCGARQVDVIWACTTDFDAVTARAVTLGVRDALYLYRHTKPSAPPPATLAKLRLVCTREAGPGVKEGVKQAQGLAVGIELARECANRPGNHCTPTHLAEQAQSIGAMDGMSVEVLDRKAVEKLGMGAFVAVARGSDEPLRFIVLRYQGAGKKDAPVVLVGKGITFDTGGISIKPSAEMDEMKFDMGGAASVLGTFRALAELQPKLNVVGLIPACENMPDGRATKPGDVVTSLSGQTIEVLNTDAEGRLVLCDALTYAERFKPAVVIDIATLTGACVVALGHQRSGLFTADEALAAELLAAGDAALDPAWRMPMDDEYEEALKSHFADVGNVGGRAGGAITAALFLRRFTKAYRWAHLDIAGTAWKSGAAKGATGRPVALLTQFLLTRAGQPKG